MSEMELSVFRQRSMEAMRQEARRGELHLTVAVGHVKTEDGHGRRGTRVTIERGRKRVMRDNLRRNWKDWEVLLHDHPAG